MPQIATPPAVHSGRALAAGARPLATSYWRRHHLRPHFRAPRPGRKRRDGFSRRCWRAGENRSDLVVFDATSVRERTLARETRPYRFRTISMAVEYPPKRPPVGIERKAPATARLKCFKISAGTEAMSGLRGARFKILQVLSRAALSTSRVQPPLPASNLRDCCATLFPPGT
jgi:hypothetical protein